MAWLARELRIFSKWVIQIFSEKMVIAPMPKLSVIVPVYNTEKYLRECIDSILAQTFTDFELILVDDGSTDKSGAICDEYCRLDDRIRVIHQNNGGVTVARKRGVELSSGEYVTFVDSDDWIDKSVFAEVLAFQNADILIYDMVREFPKGSVLVVNDMPAGNYSGERLKQLFSVMLFSYEKQRPAVHPSLCTKLIRREIIEQVIQNVADNIAYGEDALCSYACMLDAKSIIVTGKTGYHYRDNRDSVCNVYSAVMIDRFILLGDELARLFRERSADMELQLRGYMALHCLECIRSELLFHLGASYTTKRKNVQRLISNSRIKKALNTAAQRFCDPKTKLKVWLASKEMVFILYLLYLAQNKISYLLHKG